MSMGYGQKRHRFVRHHCCCCGSCDVTIQVSHWAGHMVCFLLLRNRTEESLRGWMKKTHHCSLDVHVCVLGRRWLQRGICDKTGVCRHHFLLLQLCNHKPLIPVPSPTRIMQILDFTANHHQKLPCDQVHAVSTHKALQRPLMLWTEMKVWTSQSVNIFPRSNYEVQETGDHLAVTSTGRKYF